MRWIVRTLLLVLAITGANATLHAEELDLVAVDALVKSYADADEPGISVAIAKDGEPIYEDWVGQADLERVVPIGPQSRFEIASISKQFTAFAIMMLANEQKLDLDDDVRDYLPELLDTHAPIRIRHLLSHTGGLREINTLYQMRGLRSAAGTSHRQSLSLILRQQGVNFAAGAKEEYSNTGYQLLAEIVARVSGKAFSQFMDENVLTPLGMTQTFVRADPDRLIDDLAVSYRPAGDGFARARSVSTNIGSTGMVSTPRDLLKWGHALNTGSLGGGALIDLMAERFVLPNGDLVVAGNGQEFRDFRGIRTWSHGGTSGGYKSFLLRLPEEGIVIVVMGNRADFLKATFAFDIAEALLAERLSPEADVGPLPESPDQLDRYVGDYRLFPGVVFSIRRVGDDLTVAGFGATEGSAIPQIAPGVFQFNPVSDIRLVFRDFEEGRASRMRWQVSEDGYIPAPRVTMAPMPDGSSDKSVYAGTYYSESLQTGFALHANDEGLFIEDNAGEPVRLEEYQPGVFRPLGQSPFQRIDFGPSTEGHISKVTVSSTLAENFRFLKILPRGGP